ncbi:MAG: lactate racemase domain-containing protein [Candidatus Sifarchaeia archaeon]
MRVDLRYGEEFLPLDLSDRFTIEQVAPQVVTKHPNISSELLRVIESPIDSQPFSRRVSEVDSIAIVVNRIEQVVLIEELLNSLLNSVDTFAFNPDNVSIIYPADERISKIDVDECLGNPESRGHMLILHNPKNEASLKFIGETPSHSTPVQINEAYLCADLKIGLADIRPDLFYGATGGRMSVNPSVSGNRTIHRNAKLRTSGLIGPFEMETPSCIDLLETSQLAGLDFIVNAVTDWHGNLAHIVAGNPISSWTYGVNNALRLAKADFNRRADIAIVSAGGQSHDATLYDAIDCLHSAYAVTEHGGSIVLVAECSEDIGPRGFLRGMSEFSSAEDLITTSETNFELGMEKSRFFWEILGSRNVVICSRLRDSLVKERLHCTPASDPQEGFEVAQGMLASSKKVAILYDGVRTTPKLSRN